MSTLSYSCVMSLRIALLGLLSVSGPASGYDLTKKFELSVAHVWQAGHSQIYPELAKMTADGLVTVKSEGPRGRKIYTITPDGTAELRTWLVEHTPSAPARSEFGLQAFLLPLLEPDEALAVLERMRAYYEARLSELESIRPARHEPEQRSRLGMFALDLGLRQVRAGVEWAADSIVEIERRG
jgi:PadR family transcriptional regulator AphA